MEKLLGGKLYKSKSITELLTTERFFYEDKTGGEFRNTGHSLSLCECCGFRERAGSPETCVCTGTEWYQNADGRVECIIHRQMRAVREAEGRRFFDFGRLFR